MIVSCLHLSLLYHLLTVESSICIGINIFDITFVGFFLHLALQIFLLFWLPTLGQAYLLYVTSGLWGASDAIWQTLINGKHHLVIN